MPPIGEELHENEEEPSSSVPNKETMHEPRQGYKFKPCHPLENLFIDVSTRIF